MRRLLVLLIIFAITVAPAFCQATEALLGRIVSVDQGKNELRVRLNPDPEQSEDAEAGQQGQEITVTYPEGSLPPSMKAGTVIRIWGDYAAGDSQIFESRAIRQGFCRAGEDPTGVRSRIGRSPGSGRMGRMPGHHGR